MGTRPGWREWVTSFFPGIIEFRAFGNFGEATLYTLLNTMRWVGYTALSARLGAFLLDLNYLLAFLFFFAGGEEGGVGSEVGGTGIPLRTSSSTPCEEFVLRKNRPVK